MKFMKQVARFFEYLHPADGAVIEGLGFREVVYAENQPQYIPLRTLVSQDREGRVLSRWTLTEEQRHAIASGADIYLELMTFHNPLQPIRIAIGRNPNAEFFDNAYFGCSEVNQGTAISANLGDPRTAEKY